MLSTLGNAGTKIDQYTYQIKKLQDSEVSVKAVSVNYAALLKEKEDYISRINKENSSLKQNLEISEKEKLSQQHNEHVHYLGPSGYATRRTKWCVDDPIASLTGYESTNSSTLSSELTGRSYDWIRARTKPQEGGGYYFPNDKMKEVFEKMGELQRQVSDGSWTLEGHDDILSRALGQKEHGGRVRGVGGGAKIKDVFGSRKTKHSGLVSVDELATITQEITKKFHKEFKEKMNEMMNSKLEGIFDQFKQMGRINYTYEKVN
ncbi:hypothetical protein AgCh_026588 [Apium graveolens]